MPAARPLVAVLIAALLGAIPINPSITIAATFPSTPQASKANPSDEFFPESDRMPGRVTTSPNGSWVAVVKEGGTLQMSPAGGAADAELSPVVTAATEVLPELAFSPDGKLIVYAQRRNGPETDLMLESLPPTGSPRVLTDWPGSEDRPVFSPDGRRLAFVSGRTGYASLYVMDVALGQSSAVQITNVGVKRSPENPGTPPIGFVPPPESNVGVHWQGNTLNWTNAGLEYSAQIPE